MSTFSLLVSVVFIFTEHINPSEYFVFNKYTFCKLPGAQFNLF